jgi:hypothetical protein
MAIAGWLHDRDLLHIRKVSDWGVPKPKHLHDHMKGSLLPPKCGGIQKSSPSFHDNSSYNLARLHATICRAFFGQLKHQSGINAAASLGTVAIIKHHCNILNTNLELSHSIMEKHKASAPCHGPEPKPATLTGYASRKPVLTNWAP